MDTFEKVLFLILGWSLGLLSPIIVEAIRRRREAAEVKVALGTELHELQYRLAISCYRIERHYGDVDRKSLEWLRPIVQEYRGINPSETMRKLVEEALSLTDEQIAASTQQSKASPDITLSLAKYSVPLLDAKIASLSWFNESLRNQLLELKVHLGFLNEDVERERYFQGLTFQANISAENYDIAVKSRIYCHKQYASRARTIVDILRKIRL